MRAKVISFSKNDFICRPWPITEQDRFLSAPMGGPDCRTHVKSGGWDRGTSRKGAPDTMGRIDSLALNIEIWVSGISMERFRRIGGAL